MLWYKLTNNHIEMGRINGFKLNQTICSAFKSQVNERFIMNRAKSNALKQAKLFILLSIGVLFGSVSASSQQMQVNLTNLTQEVFLLSDIRSITFSEYAMNINILDGTVATFEFSNILSYTFETYSGIDQPGSNEVTSFDVFPNPANDWLNVNIRSAFSGEADITIFDTCGRFVAKVYQGSITNNLMLAYPLQLEAGLYLLTLEIGHELTSKTIVVY
jgi:hypothetical protein